MSVLDLPPRMGLERFRDQLEAEGIADPDAVVQLAVDLLRLYRMSSSERNESRSKGSDVLRGGNPALDLEDRWYASLEAGGRPDYGVYGADAYLADLWACWIRYSRAYLMNVRRELEPSLEPWSVADLGCGIGWTTAALKEMFPRAAVHGTNLPDTVQTRMAERMGTRYGFAVRGEPEPADLVFASEYFEHFREPVWHLRDVLNAADPDALLIASTFGPRSVGHFPSYLVDGEEMEPRAASRAFNRELRRRGYEKIDTRMWNARPTYWRRPR